ncbi:MAG: DUF58 domain-containing protein [Cyclobacteriaceae bacterium]|nr:DUF58 domain-containing protein [Cyclobacteriaceae bacterium]
MKNEIQDLLQSDIINSISGLELVARAVTEEHMHGLNKSVVLGTGGEFSQYRSYEPGDDLRLIDWKVYGRSERYYTKLAEEETNIKVKFILDASNSMCHEQDGISKIDFAKVIIASLGYLSFHQGDAIGLFAINDVNIHTYPSQVQKLYSNFLYQLLEVKAQGRWPSTMQSLDLLHQPNEKGLIIFISDMYQENDEILNVVKKLKTGLNEVVFLQIMSKNELELSYKGVVTFEDLETGEKLKINSKEVNKNYHTTIESHFRKIKDELLDAGIIWEKFVIGEPLSETLASFIKRRKQLL